MMWSGTEELSMAWTRMAGGEDAIMGIKDEVTRGNFGKGARIVSGARHHIMAMGKQLVSTHKILLLPIPLPHKYVPRCLPREGTRTI